MPETTTKLSTLLQVLVLSQVTLEIFFLGLGGGSGDETSLGLTVAEINIKKVQKQDFKGCRDGLLKSMQTRYNSEGKFIKPYPYIFLHYSCRLM